MLKTQLAVLTTIFALTTNVVMAQVKPEDAIKYRKSVYTVIGWNFTPMAAMVKGEKPYDKDAFARHAAIVEQMSKLPLEGFTPGSDKGDTKTKPEVWSKMDDFKAKMEKMQAETSKLAVLAKTGDLGVIKAQFNATGAACKGCHDDYRNK